MATSACPADSCARIASQWHIHTNTTKMNGEQRAMNASRSVLFTSSFTIRFQM
jgi:hypothetical protein